MIINFACRALLVSLAIEVGVCWNEVLLQLFRIRI